MTPMTSWHIIVNIYLALALICGLITWFLTRDKKACVCWRAYLSV